MARFRYASLNAGGYLLCTDADTIRKHLNAVTYAGLDDDQRKKARSIWPGVENVAIRRIYFMSKGLELISAADKYCARSGIMII